MLNQRKKYNRQEVIADIAYQLYQKRLLLNEEGSEESDWLKACEIYQSQTRRLLHYEKRMLRWGIDFLQWFRKGVANKTSWDWLQLLIVPSFLAVSMFEWQRRTVLRQERIAEEQATLHRYFNQMDGILAEGLRQSSEDSAVRSIARGVTATTIKTLDSELNTLLISFLQEAEVIQGGKSLPLLNNLNLREAQLSNADLGGARLGWTKLDRADLSDALLSGADLRESSLINANLKKADLSYSDLAGANLTGADLTDANLEKANLSGSEISEIQVRGSIICHTTLPEGFLIDADRDCNDEGVQ